MDGTGAGAAQTGRQTTSAMEPIFDAQCRFAKSEGTLGERRSRRRSFAETAPIIEVRQATVTVHGQDMLLTVADGRSVSRA